MNYSALTDAVSRDRSPSFSVWPMFRTDTGRCFGQTRADVSDRHGPIHAAPIGFDLLFEPLVTKFLSGNIECAVDVGIDLRKSEVAYGDLFGAAFFRRVLRVR